MQLPCPFLTHQTAQKIEGGGDFGIGGRRARPARVESSTDLRRGLMDPSAALPPKDPGHADATRTLGTGGWRLKIPCKDRPIPITLGGSGFKTQVKGCRMLLCSLINSGAVASRHGECRLHGGWQHDEADDQRLG